MQEDKVTFFFKTNILEKLPEAIREKVCVAGGAVRDKLLDLEIKDYDIFVDSEATEIEVLKFFQKKGKEGNINSQTANFTYEGKWIQVIRGKYFDMSTTACIDSFDFIHCCAMITMDGFKCNPNFYKAIATKHIMVNKLEYPLSSLERLSKYVKRGFMPCNGTLMDLTKAIQKVDLSNPNSNTLTFYQDGTARFVGVD